MPEIANTLPLPCGDCQTLFQDQPAHDAHKAEAGICLYPLYSGLEPGHPVQVWRLATNPTDDEDDL